MNTTSTSVPVRRIDAPGNSATAGSAGASLSIGDLAERTGVAPATLRMWEQRHGFPVPDRLESGHRRYSEADVAGVEEVGAAEGKGWEAEAEEEKKEGDEEAKGARTLEEVRAALRRNAEERKALK